jgi:hypothetical protein
MLNTETLALQTVPKSTLIYEPGLHDPEVLDEAPPAPVNGDDILTAEQVAKVLAGVSAIGVARTALGQAGWNATIAGNRITVNQEVEAQFIAANGKTWWQVYTADGTTPVWIVGAQADPANRVGCVE